MTLQRTIGAVTFMAAATIASAQSPSSGPIAGAGVSSCAEYTERGSDELLRRMYVSWLQGFLSGMNSMNYEVTKQTILLPDRAAIMARIDNFCRANPEETPYRGAFLYFMELQSRHRE